MKIFVGNLDESTKEGQLRALFEQFGQVTECDIIKNFGFVHMAVEEEGHAAIAALHGYEINGTRINVEHSTGDGRRGGRMRGGPPFRGGRGGRGGRGEYHRSQPYGERRDYRSESDRRGGYSRGGGLGSYGGSGRGGGGRGGGRGGGVGGRDRDGGYAPLSSDTRDSYREVYKEAYMQAYRDLYRDISSSRNPGQDSRAPVPHAYNGSSRDSVGDPYRRPPPEYYDRVSSRSSGGHSSGPNYSGDMYGRASSRGGYM